ncbi:hypothetical protein B0H14DRAFT_2622356 [Mycena olivaceomarginata]|nr:hypothetical protein B0H14DRAFT_2622356 [Mycena olivaceomarginata]
MSLYNSLHRESMRQLRSTAFERYRVNVQCFAPRPSVLSERSDVRHFDGHIQNRMGVFGVHFGDPHFLLRIPSQEEAVAPDGYKFQLDDFRRPLWVNPKYPYLVLLPRFNPFYGPLFSCLNVTRKNLPIQQVTTLPLDKTLPQTRWGLEQTLIDRWLHLESLLLLTLRNMSRLYGGPVAVGVYTFLNPISYRYTERNAQSRSSARDIALRSRDAFSTPDGEDHPHGSDVANNKLHHQWLIDLEDSAVGDLTIDRMGGIFDLTRSKSHPDEHIPRHARWLFPYLLGKHRGFPPNEPIPDALVKIGFVPDVGEVDYLQSLPGDVAFSPWSVTASVCKSHRDGAPPSAPPSSHAPPTYQHSEMPADSTSPAISFPAVERDSGQKHGEDIHAFMKRRRLHNEKRAQNETSEAKSRRLAKKTMQSREGHRARRGLAYSYGRKRRAGFSSGAHAIALMRLSVGTSFTSNQRIYDSFSNQWDLCTALAPSEEAEPDEMYDDDDSDDSYVQFHQPALPADIIPSIPDVPGRQTMEGETGERATEVLERAYDLDRENLYEDADNLPGWRMQDVASTILHRFGFEQPVAPFSSSREMEHKACAWAVGDESYAVPDDSVLPTFLQHLLEDDLRGFQAELCDLTSPDSDLALEWNVDVEIISQRDKKLYSIRPCGSEAPVPSILLESAATRRDAFLHSPRGRAALFYGGIVGRLARLAIPDFADIACLDPSEDILKTGARVLSGNREEALWHEALTPDEINLICGVYSVETGTTKEQEGRRRTAIEVYLLVANPNRLLVVQVLTRDGGTPTVSGGSVKRLKEIERKSAKLHTYAEWKNKIRFSNVARKVSLKNDEVSAQYLAARLR